MSLPFPILPEKIKGSSSIQASTFNPISSGKETVVFPAGIESKEFKNTDGLVVAHAVLKDLQTFLLKRKRVKASLSS